MIPVLNHVSASGSVHRAALAIVALACACSGGGSGRGGPAGPFPSTGTLVVHVERDGAGPEVGALVRIASLDRSVRTGVDGEARFADLAPGDYTVRIEPDGDDPFERAVSFVPPFPARIEILLPALAAPLSLEIQWDGQRRMWGGAVELRAVVEGGDAANVEWRSLDDLYIERPVVLGSGETLVTRVLKPGRTRVEARLLAEDGVLVVTTVNVDVLYRERWNVDLLDLVPLPANTVGDVWVDGGRAFVARRGAGGLSIVELDGFVGEIARYSESGMFTQDVKAADGLAYLTNESDEHPDAVVVVDVADPGDVRRRGAIGRGVIRTAHNVWIDGTTLYSASSASDQFAAFDVTDPSTPTRVGRLDAASPHDIHVADGIAYGSVLRVTDGDAGELVVMTAPDLTRIGSATWFGAFTHSSWPSENGRFLHVADELLNAPIRILDVSTPANPVEVGRYQPRLGAVPHNFQVRGRFAFLSHYVHGVEVIDLADPANPELVGFFDTRPGADDTSQLDDPFQGAWGVHWTDDGRFVVSDMQRGVFVFRYTGPGGP